jgi:hypothetical protein
MNLNGRVFKGNYLKRRKDKLLKYLYGRFKRNKSNLKFTAFKLGNSA